MNGSQNLTPERILDELADIAFADLRDPAGVPVKPTDKLRALEMLYRHLHMGEGDDDSRVVLIDEVSP